MSKQGELERISIFILRALHRKQQSEDSGPLTENEQILLTACEFWLACENKSLRSHLGTQYQPQLDRAKKAFDAIGARHTATVLDRQNGSTTVIRNIENQICNTDEDIDGYLMSFAARCCIDETGFQTSNP